MLEGGWGNTTVQQATSKQQRKAWSEQQQHKGRWDEYMVWNNNNPRRQMNNHNAR
jgi:hypothetical protein